PPCAVFPYATLFRSVPDGRDAVEGPLDARPVVLPELPHPLDDEVDVLPGDEGVAQVGEPVGEPSFGLAPQVEDDLCQAMEVGHRLQSPPDMGREALQELGQVVDHFAPAHGSASFTAPRKPKVAKKRGSLPPPARS